MNQPIVAIQGKRDNIPTLALLDQNFMVVNEKNLSLDEVIELGQTIVFSGTRQNTRVVINPNLSTTLDLPLESRLRIADDPKGYHNLVVTYPSSSKKLRSEEFEKKYGGSIAIGLLITRYESRRDMAFNLFKRGHVGEKVSSDISYLYSPNLELLEKVPGTLIGYIGTRERPYWITLTPDDTKIELRDKDYKLLHEKVLEGIALESVIVPSRKRTLAISTRDLDISAIDRKYYLSGYQGELNDVFREEDRWAFTHLTPWPFDSRAIIAYATQDDLHILESNGGIYSTRLTFLENDDYASKMRRIEPIQLDGKNFLVAENAAGEIGVIGEQFSDPNSKCDLILENLGYAQGENYIFVLKKLGEQDYLSIQFGVSPPQIFDSRFQKVPVQLPEGIRYMAVIPALDMLALTLQNSIELYSANFEKIKNVSINGLSDLSHIVSLERGKSKQILSNSQG